MRLMGPGLFVSAIVPTILVALGACGGPDAPLQSGQVVGGASKQITDVQSVRGFLPKPELLVAGGGSRPALVYMNRNVRFSSYSKIMLDPVAIWAAPGSELSTLPQSERDQLVVRFQDALFRTLPRYCNLVNAPSAGTLRFRFALTDATDTNPVVNTVTTYTPYLSTGLSAASVVFNNGVGYFTGTASAEGYATDAMTGTLVWQAVDKRGGTGALVKNTLDNWLDVDRAMQAWAEKLASRLQELGVCRA